MAKIKLYVSEGGSLNQGGSGKDTIYSETGTISTATIQGQEGNDLLYFGNQTTATTIRNEINSAGSAAVGDIEALSAGTVTLSYSGYFVSANKVENLKTSTSTLLSGTITASTASAGLTYAALRNTGVSSLQGVTINGNAGNDSVFLGDQIKTAAASHIGGGAGNDLVGTYNSGAATAGQLRGTYSAVTINGGAGDDTVWVNYSGASAKDVVVNGNAGNDSVTFSGVSAGLYSSLIGGGAGNDTMTIDALNALSYTINGGDGNDKMTINMSGADGVVSQSAGLIQGDTKSNQSGDDTILFAGKQFGNSTIQGLAGNDSIVISSLTGGGANLLAGNGGNDTIYVKSAGVQSGDLSAWTVNGGAGNDSIQITANSAGALKSSLFNGGDGADTISIGMFASAGAAGSEATTINGGGGADKLTNSAFGSAGGSGVFAWSSYDASTIDAMDTIAFQTGAISAGAASFGSSKVTLQFEQGGLALATGTGLSGVSAKSGNIVFSSYTDEDLTARVSTLDASFTTTGNVAIFTTDGTQKFLFVQGGATDTVIKFGAVSALSAGGANIIVKDGGSAIGLGD